MLCITTAYNYVAAGVLNSYRLSRNYSEQLRRESDKRDTHLVSKNLEEDRK